MLENLNSKKFTNAIKTLTSTSMGTENMGPFLYSLIKFVRPHRVLEIGSGLTTIYASVVDAAIWGVNITFGFLNKIFSLAGSVEKTSTAAPAIRFAFRASFKSFSSMILPLAALIM